MHSLYIKIIIFCIAVLITCIASISIYDKVQISSQPVKNISVNIHGDPQPTDKAEIHSIINKYYPHNYIKGDINKLTTHLSKLAWIKNVVVRRKNNFVIDINIVKRNIIGYWHNPNYLLDEQGNIIAKHDIILQNTQLPTLECSEDDIVESIGYLKQFQNLLLNYKIKIVKLMFKNGMMHATTNTGTKIELYGRKSTAKLIRFVSIHNLLNRIANIKSINLNYTSGLSVKWGNK